MLRLLNCPKSINPYESAALGVRLFSLEELCFLIESKMYLIDESWIGEALFSWMEKELLLDATVKGLRECLKKERCAFACAALILKESGLYDERELSGVLSRLLQMKERTKLERRKLSGDLFLDNGKYRQAAYTYLELLGDAYANQMTEELRGDLLHNLGVVYARLFLFSEAADCFSQAYELRKSKASRDAYLFAMNFMDDSYAMDERAMELSFAVMRGALGRLNEVAEQAAFSASRKEASAAIDAGTQAELISRWSKGLVMG